MIITACGGSKGIKSLPGTAEGANQLAKMFMDSKADKMALTIELKPTLEDCKAMFNTETVATKAFEVYTGAFNELQQGKMALGPKSADQTETIITPATTEELQKPEWTGAVYDHFPNGYHDVATHFNAGITIYQIKFVKPGKKVACDLIVSLL